jgi:hypothetical protein
MPVSKQPKWIVERSIEKRRIEAAQMGLMTYDDGSLTQESEQMLRAANAVRMGMNFHIQDQHKPMGFFKGLFIGFICVIMFVLFIIH